MKTKKEEPLLTRDVQREVRLWEIGKRNECEGFQILCNEKYVGEWHGDRDFLKAIIHDANDANWIENEKPCPWIRTTERKPTEEDFQPTGQVILSLHGGGVSIAGKHSIGVYNYNDWMPIPPVPEGQQAPAATAVQTETESLGSSVGERCAEKLFVKIVGEEEQIKRLSKITVAAIINQEVNEKES